MIALSAIAIAIAIVGGLVMIYSNFVGATKTALDLRNQEMVDPSGIVSPPQPPRPPKQLPPTIGPEEPTADHLPQAERSASKQHDTQDSIWGRPTNASTAFKMPSAPQQTHGVDSGEVDWIELEERLTSIHPGEFEARSYE
ncbi:MAG: hypothetical protein A4S17_05495 [Proteobacteria bacterium HN_bin10]|nr:MAG: hypothetical protein A4S17_05495 [Proteobacteria bacterium HN_bin10]